jgi:hypothetical protein
MISMTSHQMIGMRRNRKSLKAAGRIRAASYASCDFTESCTLARRVRYELR